MKDMLGIVVRKLVTLPDSDLGVVCDLLEKFSDPDWVGATKKLLRKENPWPKTPQITSDLLEFITTASFGPVGQFSAAEVIKTRKIGDTKFWFSENFKRVFGSLVETNVPAANMRVFRLKKGSVDGPILKELGGAEQVRTFVAHIFALACQQGQGREGVLLTNWGANIFYVPDPNNPEIVWTVYCYWSSGIGHWRFSAYPIADPHEWNVDNHVFARDSGS
jgi:hypothetical protein